MTRTQRIVAVFYCLLVVYCGVWIPWHYDIGELKGIKEGYGLVWNGPPEDQGVPDIAAVAARVLAATGLCAAAFLLARKWKVLLSVAILAGAGILLFGYWTDKAAEHRTQKIHDCAVAKVATTPLCTPPDKNGFEVCGNPTAQDEETAVAAAEKDCTRETEPKKKSAHEQIEEYKHQHGIEQ